MKIMKIIEFQLENHENHEKKIEFHVRTQQIMKIIESHFGESIIL